MNSNLNFPLVTNDPPDPSNFGDVVRKILQISLNAFCSYTMSSFYHVRSYFYGDMSGLFFLYIIKVTF